jgi:hypothetical protein
VTDGINELGFAALCYLALKECLGYFKSRKKTDCPPNICPLIDHKDWDELLQKTRDMHHTNTEMVKVLAKLAAAADAQTIAMIEISAKIQS